MLAPYTEPTVASVFAPRTTHRRRRHGGRLCQPVRRDRPGARHGACAAPSPRRSRARGVRRIPMLFQHDPAEPVGIWLELREDHRGLYARGRLIPDVARARELLSLLRAGAIDGLSIGFTHREGPHRSAQPHPQALCGRSLGNFHRHVPAARGSARARGEAGALPGRLSLARTRAERGLGRRTIRRGRARRMVAASRPRRRRDDVTRCMSLRWRSSGCARCAPSARACCDLKWLRATTRLEIALHRHHRALRYAEKAGFNPDQPRDWHGRWTDGGGRARPTAAFDWRAIFRPGIRRSLRRKGLQLRRNVQPLLNWPQDCSPSLPIRPQQSSAP